MALTLTLLTGCSARPSLQDVEPAMTEAVRAVVGGEGSMRPEVFLRCGPTDELLDGLRLQLDADVPAGSVDLEDALMTSDGAGSTSSSGTAPAHRCSPSRPATTGRQTCGPAPTARGA